jgi:hypothetical protein
MRAKSKMQQKNYHSATANAELPFDMDKAMANFYDKEFRRWHFKLIMIITSLFGSIYLIALNFSSLFNG